MQLVNQKEYRRYRHSKLAEARQQKLRSQQKQARLSHLDAAKQARKEYKPAKAKTTKTTRQSAARRYRAPKAAKFHNGRISKLTDQALETAAKLKPPKNPILKKRNTFAYASTMLALAIFTTGMFMTQRALEFNEDIRAEVQGVTSQDQPADDAPFPGREDDREVQPNVSAWTVAPNMPRYLSIPKLGTQARVLEVGRTEDNKVDAPQTIYDAGWYNGSSRVGSGKGAALIDGHVSGYTSSGVFYNLKNLVKGDVVEVEMGNGKVYSYKVEHHEVVSLEDVDMAKALRPFDPSKEGLNLMTCGGSFNYETENYNERVIVYTSRVK